jgi:hypothetical protein
MILKFWLHFSGKEMDDDYPDGVSETELIG